MDEELLRAMVVSIKGALESDEPTLDRFVDGFMEARPDLLDRYVRPLAIRQLRTMIQSLLNAAVAKGFEEIRASGRMPRA